MSTETEPVVVTLEVNLDETDNIPEIEEKNQKPVETPEPVEQKQEAVEEMEPVKVQPLDQPKEPKETHKHSPSIKGVNIASYAFVMGLQGLGLVYKKTHEHWEWSEVIPDIIMYVALAFAALFSVLYIIKIFKEPAEVKKEWNHPIRRNFFAAVPIVIMLFSLLFNDKSYDAAVILGLVGITLQILFTLYLLGVWIQDDRMSVDRCSTILFLPVVAVLLGGLVFAKLPNFHFHKEIMYFCLGVGTMLWIKLNVNFFQRSIYGKKWLQGKFAFANYILLAPTAIMAVTIEIISKRNGGTTASPLAIALWGCSLFYLLFNLRLLPLFFKVGAFNKYAISMNAVIFPNAALTVSTFMVEYSLNIGGLLLGLVIFLTVVTTVVFIATIINMFKGEFFAEVLPKKKPAAKPVCCDV
ncbi:hypothetical protein PCE1_004556 [Barthelona sp. PCE]